MPRVGKTRGYKKVFSFENAFDEVRLIRVEDISVNTFRRSSEVIQLAAKMILLSSQKGRPKTFEKEVDNEAA